MKNQSYKNKKAKKKKTQISDNEYFQENSSFQQEANSIHNRQLRYWTKPQKKLSLTVTKPKSW